MPAADAAVFTDSSANAKKVGFPESSQGAGFTCGSGRDPPDFRWLTR